MCDNHEVVKNADGKIQMHRRDVVRGLWAGTMVLSTASIAGCATTDQMFMPSDAQLLPMAAEAWKQTKTETPISTDRAANSRMIRIGERIKSSASKFDASLAEADWEFVVFDSEQKNAFVLPGGKVGFYKGLLDFSDNDDQVAAVLGHEVGHVSRRHAARRIGRQQAAQIGMALGTVAIGVSDMSNDQKNMAVGLLGAGTTVGVILPFSRDNELEADLVGVDYMYDAGYDVRESVSLWNKMGENRDGAQPEWMSTHPNPNTRVRELTNYINSKGYAVM